MSKKCYVLLREAWWRHTCVRLLDLQYGPQVRTYLSDDLESDLGELIESENSESDSYPKHEVRPCHFEPSGHPNDENDKENGEETDETTRKKIDKLLTTAGVICRMQKATTVKTQVAKAMLYKSLDFVKFV